MENFRLRNTEHPFFKPAWELYERTFPESERRSLEQQVELLGNKQYHAMTTGRYGEFIGLLFWWNLGETRYLEHFAVLEDHQSKGYGLQMLKCFRCAEGKRPIILEVEPPLDETSKRRVSFYRESEFHYLDHPHIQPPLREGGKEVELKLMSWPDPITVQQASAFAKQLETEVPHC